VYRLRVWIYNGREALLCTYMGYKTTLTIHVVLHYMIDFETGSSHIYL
jgi:hypothetical protein